LKKTFFFKKKSQLFPQPFSIMAAPPAEESGFAGAAFDPSLGSFVDAQLARQRRDRSEEGGAGTTPDDEA
jgi:hypothetical protein